LRTYPEELLSSGDDVSDNDGSAEGIDDVLIVWVKDEAIVDLAYRNLVRNRQSAKVVVKLPPTLHFLNWMKGQDSINSSK
jgi:hypothetical protein